MRIHMRIYMNGFALRVRDLAFIVIWMYIILKNKNDLP